MAFNISEFIAKADAKSRVLLLIVGVGILGGIVMVAGRYMSGSKTAGAAHIAGAPTGLQSVPGSQVSQEYYKALVQSNKQAAKQAQITGGSAVPTMINVSGQQPAGFAQGGNCGGVCLGDNSDSVVDDINNLVRENKLGQDDANTLLDDVKNSVSVLEFSTALSQLVKGSKLESIDARRLLAEYKNYYAKAENADTVKTVDELIKSGQVSLETGSELIDLQKRKLTPAEYAAELARLVREGKISPELAAQLLAQYTQKQMQEGLKQSGVVLKQMAAAGQIAPDVANELTDLQQRNVSVGQYQDALQKLVAEGKMTPATAQKLLALYNAQRSGLGPAVQLQDAVNAADKEATDMINGLVASGKLTAEEARLLTANQSKMTPEEYRKYLDELVREGKLTPEEAAKLMASYQKLHNAKELAKNLNHLQGNNASVSEYAQSLKQAVIDGKMTPEEAAALLHSYQAMLSIGTPSAITIIGNADKNVPGVAEFAKLQQRLSNQQNANAGAASTPTNPSATAQQFSAAETQAATEAEHAKEQRLQDLMGIMKGQADKLIGVWQTPPNMQFRAGSPPTTKGLPGAAAGAVDTTAKAGSAAAGAGPQAPGTGAPPIIKAGTIYFAVLDTAVNSDYPDTPVMATIVEGKMKGAKLLGKVTVGQGQGQDRVSLNFTQVDMDEWPDVKAVSAFAIDPDTARTVLASNVDYHYLKRYGALMATSFLTGYSSAITNAGSSQATSSGILSTKSPLSPTSKIMVGLGQIGTTLGTAAQSSVNTLPTVTVNAGVGVGILFMSDVAGS